MIHFAVDMKPFFSLEAFKQHKAQSNNYFLLISLLRIVFNGAIDHCVARPGDFNAELQQYSQLLNIDFDCTPLGFETWYFQTTTAFYS